MNKKKPKHYWALENTETSGLIIGWGRCPLLFRTKAKAKDWYARLPEDRPVKIEIRKVGE